MTNNFAGQVNSYKNNEMKQSRSVQDIVKPLQIISWIMGSGIIECPLGHPRVLISFLYATIILINYAISLYYTIVNERYMYLKNLNSTGEFLIKIITLGNAFLAVIAIILAWNRRKGLKKCIQNIGMVDELLQKMGISKDYDKTMKREIGNICAMFSIIIIVMIINSYALVIKGTPTHIAAIMIISAHYPLILVFVADMMFLIVVRCMRRKFARLNALLKSMSSTSALSPQYMKLLYQKTGLLKPTAGFNKKTNDDTLLMKAAKQVHLDLVKISRSVNETFGLQILVSMALSLVFITGLLYFSYTVMYKTPEPKKDIIMGLISSSCWLFFYVMKILIINHICDRTSAEALRTGNIICELHEPMTNKEFRSEIREFVLQLIQNPLKFTAYEFVSLDYTFIQGVVGSITTYLVILIQLSTDIKNGSTSASNSTNETNIKL